MAKRLIQAGFVTLTASLLCSCGTIRKPKGDKIVVSVDDQRLVVMKGGTPLKSYPVSTSKFGLGSRPRSNHTPLGKMYVYQKIGEGARPGTVFKSRKPTGEVIRPNAPGRDPIVSRILWLEGLERSNANTKERLIYIHGTAEERTIGRPASYGCIRMKSRDVIDLYERVGVGTTVQVKRSGLRIAEIPDRDRPMVAAASLRSKAAPSEGLSSRSRPKRESKAPREPVEVVAAAAPQRRPALREDKARRTIRRPAAPPATKKASSAPTVADRPVRRRGAFTRLPEG